MLLTLRSGLFFSDDSNSHRHKILMNESSKLNRQMAVVAVASVFQVLVKIRFIFQIFVRN